MRNLTGGWYPISPGKALGFCFIPFFNLYWFVHMPLTLANEVKRLAPQAEVSPGAVVTLQVLSIIPGCCVYGLFNLFQSIAMVQIQRGLNQLWAGYNPAAQYQAQMQAAQAAQAMASAPQAASNYQRG